VCYKNVFKGLLSKIKKKKKKLSLIPLHVTLLFRHEVVKENEANDQQTTDVAAKIYLVFHLPFGEKGATKKKGAPI